MPAVGKNIPHDSAVGHVTGQSTFLDDVAPASGEWLVDFLGSPVAHGRIRSVDLSAAAAKSLGIRQDGVAEVRLEIYRPSGDSGSQDRCLFDQTVES